MPYASDRITAKLNDLVNSHEMYVDLAEFDDLNTAYQALIGTWELANEVYNGGFMQYFHNSSREHARPMVEILRIIDAPHAADILARAIKIVGPGTRWGDEPNFLTAINSIPEDLRRQVTDLERKLYDALDDLHSQLFRYLSNHRDQIDAPAEFWAEGTIQ